MPDVDDDRQEYKDYSDPEYEAYAESRASNGGARHKFTLQAFATVHRHTDGAYLIKDLIPSHGLTVVWGAPKCGKSFWAFDAAMHVAIGRDYRGLRVNGGPVVYLALEGGKAFGNRVDAWKQTHGIGEAPFFLVTEPVALVADCKELCRCIDDQMFSPPVLVVIDTLNRSLHGSENSDVDMSAFIKAADAIAATFQCAVMIVHHCGHLMNERPRGHSSLMGACDCQIAVRRADDGVIACNVDFMKDGLEGTKVFSRLEVIDLGEDVDGDDITSCVIVATEPPPGTETSRRKPPPRWTRLLLRVLAGLIADHGEERRPFADGPGVRAVPTNLLRDEFRRQHGSDNQNTVNKAFRRARDDAQAENYIAIRDGWIWLVQGTKGTTP